jgi:hypothetical protein
MEMKFEQDSGWNETEEKKISQRQGMEWKLRKIKEVRQTNLDFVYKKGH